MPSLESLATGGSGSVPSSSSPNMQNNMASKRPPVSTGTGGRPFPGPSSLETMQRSVMKAFSLKYSEWVGEGVPGWVKDG